MIIEAVIELFGFEVSLEGLIGFFLGFWSMLALDVSFGFYSKWKKKHV
jgi:hypothetical protein